MFTGQLRRDVRCRDNRNVSARDRHDCSRLERRAVHCEGLGCGARAVGHGAHRRDRRWCTDLDRQRLRDGSAARVSERHREVRLEHHIRRSRDHAGVRVEVHAGRQRARRDRPREGCSAARLRQGRLYGTPGVPLGSDSVVIVGTGLIITWKVPLACGSKKESLSLTVRVLRPAEVGVPVRNPVDGSIVSPGDPGCGEAIRAESADARELHQTAARNSAG